MRFSSKLVRVVVDGREDYILLIRVLYRPDKVVADSRDKAWIRVGDQKHRLGQEERLEQERDRGQVAFEQEPVFDMPYPTSFDTDRIARFAEAFRKSRSLTYDQTDEQIMAMRHLGRIESGTFVPNIACVLLFAQDPTSKFPGCRIRFRRFEGVKEGTGAQYNAVKEYWVEGNAATVMESTAQILES